MAVNIIISIAKPCRITKPNTKATNNSGVSHHEWERLNISKKLLSNTTKTALITMYLHLNVKTPYIIVFSFILILLGVHYF